MQRGTGRRPEDDRRSHARKDSGESLQSAEDDVRATTETQDLRDAARAFEESYATDDAYFAQFKMAMQADRNGLLKTIQTKQQESIDADAAFLDQIHGPLADALRPRIPPRSSSTKAPAIPTCPMAASGARILQLSKQLLKNYEEAKKAVDGEGLKGGRLGDRWPADVEKLRNLLDVGYRKAQDDVATVLQGHGGGGGKGGDEHDDGGEAKTGGKDAKETQEADAFFVSGKEKQVQREQFNVTQALLEGARGVRRLSRSLPPESLE